MFRQRTRCISRRRIERPCTKRDEQALSAHRQWRQMVSLNRPPSGTMIATPRRIPSWNDKHQYATRPFGSGDGNMPPREAGEPITDQSMARQLGLAASENKKRLRQRTATIRREQTAKNATGRGIGSISCGLRAAGTSMIPTAQLPRSPSTRQALCRRHPSIFETTANQRLSRRPRHKDRPSGNAIRTGRMEAMIAVKRAIILLRFDWLTGSIGALLW